MSKALTLNEMAEFMWNTLEQAIEDSMPEASTDEREEAKYRILDALSRSMFH